MWLIIVISSTALFYPLQKVSISSASKKKTQRPVDEKADPVVFYISESVGRPWTSLFPRRSSAISINIDGPRDIYALSTSSLEDEVFEDVMEEYEFHSVYNGSNSGSTKVLSSRYAVDERAISFGSENSERSMHSFPHTSDSSFAQEIFV